MRPQTALAETLRFRVHPLVRLRRYAVMRSLLRAIDVPIWANVSGVAWKVRLRLIRHSTLFMLTGAGEPGVMALFHAIVKEVGIRSFWDIGSNVGYYTWLVKSIAPETEVRMFEPDADNLSLIEETLGATHLTSVYVRRLAVSDHIGRREFISDEVCGSTGTLETAAETFSQRYWKVGPKPVIVDTVSLDHERDSAGPPDLLKVDVEGHEESVIRGGHAMIERDQPILIFECFHGADELAGLLQALGYWLGDAERLSEPTSSLISNFVAIPARLGNDLPRLKQAWAAEMVLLRRPTRSHDRTAAPPDGR